MRQDPRKLDLKRILQFFWQGRLVLVVASLLGMVVFGYVAFFVATPVYRATTTVILETRRDNLVDFPAIVTSLTGQLTEINTEIEVLRSRVLMDRVVADLNLMADPEFNGALVPDGLRTRIKHVILDVLPGQTPRPEGPDEESEGVTNALLSRLTVTAIPSSFVFRIRASSPDPVKAALIADTVAETYIAMQIEAKEQATRDAIRALSAEVAQLRADLTEANDRLAGPEDLQDTDATRRLYEDFLARLKEANSSLGMIQPDSRVLSAAVVPNVHSEPRRTQLLVMGLVFGFVMGSFVLLLRDALVDTFRNPRALAAETGLPVLGEVPVIPAKGGAEILRYLGERPTSVAAEAVRGLRTSLFNPTGQSPPRILLITASAAGDGSTTIAITLAQNLAAMGKSVVLVDADLRQSRFDAIFGPGTGKGLMSVLQDDVILEDALFSVEPFGFDVLKGVSPDGPGSPDILSSDRFSDLIALLSDTYDVVLIDTPPVLVVPDARILGRLVQTIIFVVRADVTKRGQIAEGLRLLSDVTVDGPVLVLNMAGGPPDPASTEESGAGYLRN